LGETCAGVLAEGGGVRACNAPAGTLAGAMAVSCDCCAMQGSVNAANVTTLNACNGRSKRRRWLKRDMTEV